MTPVVALLLVLAAPDAADAERPTPDSQVETEAQARPDPNEPAPGTTPVPRPIAPPASFEGPPPAGMVKGEQRARKAEDRARNPDAVARGLGLTATTDGGYRWEDPGGRFTAHIATDGTVLFADRWRRPAKGKRRHRKKRGVCCGRPPGGWFRGLNVFGGVPVSGPTEWAIRAAGQDPAGTAKAEFLTSTRKLRVQLALASARTRMDVALGRLEDDLAAIWSATERSEASRRALIFARWDDLIEPTADPEADDSADPSRDTGPPNVDALQARYAAKARRRIVAFVRRTLPADSPQAFSRAELRTLNAQRASTGAFAPYPNP